MTAVVAEKPPPFRHTLRLPKRWWDSTNFSLHITYQERKITNKDITFTHCLLSSDNTVTQLVCTSQTQDTKYL